MNRLLISGTPPGADKYERVREWAALAARLEELLPTWARLEEFVAAEYEPLAFLSLQLFDQVRFLPGDYAECGVYLGGTAEVMAREKPENAALWLLDSFTGFPPASEYDPPSAQERHERRHYAVPLGWLERRFAEFPNVQLVPGFFSDTLPGLAERRFRFVHLDCDLYESYRETLRFFRPRMVAGGIVLLDEYGDDRWPGATRAVREQLDPEELKLCRETNRWYWKAPFDPPKGGSQDESSRGSDSP